VSRCSNVWREKPVRGGLGKTVDQLGGSFDLVSRIAIGSRAYLIPIMGKSDPSLREKEQGSMESRGVKSVLRFASRRIGELCERIDTKSR